MTEILNSVTGVAWDVLAFLVVLGIVVFVHEMGHFLVAKWNGVRVDVFSIGFGREIYGWTDKSGVRWKVSILPLGGYVKMFGDADEASGQSEKREFTEEEKQVTFQHKNVYRRFAVVFAGPAMNFLFAALVMFLLFATAGQPQTEPVINVVQENSAAEAAGMEPGDRILEINGEDIGSFEEVQRLVRLSHGAPLEITVERNGEIVELAAQPTMREEADAFGDRQEMAVLGVGVEVNRQTMVRHDPLTALATAVGQTYTITEHTLVALGQILSGARSAEELGGPLRIAEFSGHAADLGLFNFIMFIAILSINLGLLNLFPVPMLDGGHLVFYLIEMVRGRPVGERAQEIGLRIGLAMVVALMVFATWNDVSRIVTRHMS